MTTQKRSAPWDWQLAFLAQYPPFICVIFFLHPAMKNDTIHHKVKNKCHNLKARTLNFSKINFAGIAKSPICCDAHRMRE
jgi:hypothetical protein